MTDVQQYLRGELPPAEMHRLEKLALDDPFLADALEGLQDHAPADRHLAELRNRLETRVNPEKKPARMPRLKIAAAVILLLGVGFSAWYILFDKTFTAKAKIPVANREPVAADTTLTAVDSSRMTASEPVAQQPAAARAAAKKSAGTLPATAYTAPAIANARPQRPQTPHAPMSLTRTIPDILPAPAVPDTIPTEWTDRSAVAKTMVKTDTAAYFDSYSTSVFPAVASRSTPFGNNKLQSVRIGSKINPSSSANLLAFSGRVLDLNHHPVAGATLFFNSNNISRPGTITDREGYFNLYLPVADTTRHLTVAMTGYEDAQYALNTDDRSGNTIFLKENPARLDEVVITGYGAKRKETLAAPPSDEPEVLDSFWLKTAPVMGRISYLNYIERASKNLPVDTTIHGIESISFMVDQKGTLSEFKIERSLSPAHDAGLIRLIQEGPPWKMIHGRKARAVVSVSFP